MSLECCRCNKKTEWKAIHHYYNGAGTGFYCLDCYVRELTNDIKKVLPDSSVIISPLTCENCKSTNIEVAHIKRSMSLFRMTCKECGYTLEFQEISSGFEKLNKKAKKKKRGKE